jgi:hypothetical protein
MEGIRSRNWPDKSSATGGSAAFRAVSLWLTGKALFPRGYASIFVPPESERLGTASNELTVFGKPQAYRTENGKAARH